MIWSSRYLLEHRPRILSLLPLDATTVQVLRTLVHLAVSSSSRIRPILSITAVPTNALFLRNDSSSNTLPPPPLRPALILLHQYLYATDHKRISHHSSPSGHRLPTHPLRSRRPYDLNPHLSIPDIATLPFFYRAHSNGQPLSSSNPLFLACVRPTSCLIFSDYLQALR